MKILSETQSDYIIECNNGHISTIRKDYYLIIEKDRMCRHCYNESDILWDEMTHDFMGTLEDI